MVLTLDTLPSLEARLAELKRKLAARKDKKEFVENCNALRAEIDNLEERIFAFKRKAENEQA